MNALIVMPNFQLGIALPSCFHRTIAMMPMHVALNTQLSISRSHHSTNHRVNQLRALSVFETCHENLDCEAPCDVAKVWGVLALPWSRKGICFSGGDDSFDERSEKLL